MLNDDWFGGPYPFEEDSESPWVGKCANCTQMVHEKEDYHTGESMKNENFGGRPITRSYLICEDCYFEYGPDIMSD